MTADTKDHVFQVPYEWITSMWEDTTTAGHARLAMKVAGYFIEQKVRVADGQPAEWRLNDQPV